jgi:hypothetical protein
MNPYAVYLGERTPLDVISQTARRLGHLLDTVGIEHVDASPAPGKWSVRDILSHLADSEVVFAFRLRQALAEDHHVIQPFDQDQWAKSYTAYSASAAQGTFSAVREWNLALIRSVSPAAFGKPVTHPERGVMTFQTVLETMAGHDLNHIQQIERIAAQAAGAS